MGTVKEAIARDREQKAWEMRTRQGASIYTIAKEIGVTPMAVSLMLKRVGVAIHKQMAAATEAQKVEQSQQYDTIIEESISAWERSKQNAEKSVTRRKAIGVTPEGEVKERQESQPHGGSLKRSNRMTLPDIEEFDPENVPGLYIDEDGEDVPEEVKAAKIALAAAEWKAKQMRREMPLFTVEEVTTSESKGQVGDPRFLAEANKALDAKRDIWGLNAPKQTDITSNGNDIGIIGYEIILPGAGASESKD